MWVLTELSVTVLPSSAFLFCSHSLSAADDCQPASQPASHHARLKGPQTQQGTRNKKLGKWFLKSVAALSRNKDATLLVCLHFSSMRWKGSFFYFWSFIRRESIPVMPEGKIQTLALVKVIQSPSYPVDWKHLSASHRLFNPHTLFKDHFYPFLHLKAVTTFYFFAWNLTFVVADTLFLL